MRRLVVLGLLTVLAVSCSDPAEVEIELGDGDSPGADGGTGRTGDGQDGDAGGAGAPTTDPPVAPRPTGATNERPGQPERPPTVGPSSQDGSTGPPGAFARTLLRPEPATSIVFERFEQRGAEPRRASVDHVLSVLGSVSGKSVASPDAIAVPGAAQSWNPESIRDTADRLTRTGRGGGRAVLHVLFLRGSFQGNDEVLGVAVRGDALAIFGDAVSAAATPLVSAQAIEAAVLMHEIGHLLGLVDLVRDTGRDDPEHPGHSRNRESVMYWAVESGLVTQVLTGGPSRNFDEQDLEDLSALRNGE